MSFKTNYTLVNYGSSYGSSIGLHFICVLVKGWGCCALLSTEELGVLTSQVG